MLADDLHPQARFWLDVADKLIKLSAVLVGAAWTWMHYHRSRTYAQKLELQLTGRTFQRDGLYIEIMVGLKNIGAARHMLQKRGTFCETIAVYADGTQQELRFARVFQQTTSIEPGGAVRDVVYFKVDSPRSDLIWVRVDLRVIGKEVEWNDSALLQVD